MLMKNFSHADSSLPISLYLKAGSTGFCRTGFHQHTYRTHSRKAPPHPTHAHTHHPYTLTQQNIKTTKHIPKPPPQDPGTGPGGTPAGDDTAEESRAGDEVKTRARRRRQQPTTASRRAASLMEAFVADALASGLPTRESPRGPRLLAAFYEATIDHIRSQESNHNKET